MEKLKIFISVPMNGRTDEQIAKDIEEAKEYVNNIFGQSRTEFIDNFIEKPDDNKQRLYCLGEAIKKLGDCNLCFFVEGWEKYRGCVIEYHVCCEYGIPMMTSKRSKL